MPNGNSHLHDRVRHAIATSSNAPISNIEGIIHQAIGMTMEFVRCSALPALALLHGRSTVTGQPLYIVAVDVIERRYRPEPDSN